MEPAPSTFEPETDAAPTARYRSRFNRALFAWHAGARRTIAIRSATTPWAVLVGEVMSQQTQIDRIGPKWRSFLQKWPNPASLAAAATGDLLAEWSGLGYNRRALNLRRAAESIVEHHGGQVPRDVASLERLAGVGPYTARAVAATLGTPVAPVDVNVRRVVSRLVGGDAMPRSLQGQADGLVSRRDPRAWLNAVMDLAAMICTPKSPRCSDCPVSRVCNSRDRIPALQVTRDRTPFRLTRRWLRGRLLAAVLRAPAGSWVALPVRLGDHDSEAIREAAEGLAREGFLVLQGAAARINERGREGLSRGTASSTRL